MKPRSDNKPNWVLGQIPQVPREKIDREIADAKLIITNWKEAYMKLAVELGGGDFLCDEFWDEIREFASPYMYRMLMCGFITKQEYVQFFRFVNSRWRN